MLHNWYNTALLNLTLWFILVIFSSISELIHSLLSSGQVLKDDHMHGETCSQYGRYLCLRTVCTKCTRESRNFIQSFHAKQEALPAQQDTFGSTNVVTMRCSTPEPPNPGPAVPDKSISNVCLTGGHFHTWRKLKLAPPKLDLHHAKVMYNNGLFQCLLKG